SPRRESPRRRGSAASREPSRARASRDRRASGTAYPAGSAWTCNRSWGRRACFRPGKEPARLLGVGADLLRERIDVGEALLVAKLVKEFHRAAASVQRRAEIENERFEQRNGVGGDRGTQAEA